MKVFLRICFLAILVSSLWLVHRVFMHKSPHTGKIEAFQADNCAYDILAFGPSYLYVTFDTIEMYRTFGLRSCVLGSPCQPVNETYYFIKMALSEKHPQLVVLNADMIVFSKNTYVHKAAFVHEALDGYPVTTDKLDAICNLHTDSVHMEEFLIPFSKYHARWRELRKGDFTIKHRRNDYKGFMFYSLQDFKNNVKSYDLIQAERSPVFKENLDYLVKIKALVESKGMKFMLLSSPRSGGFAEGRLAALHDFAEDNGIAFLDLNLEFDKTGISNETDFYNGGHLNVLGAEKATRYIGKWITEHFDLKPTLTDRDRAEWDAEVKRYEAARAKAIAGK